MNFGALTKKAKQLVEERGGTDGLKRDAEKLKDVAQGKGTLQEKAKRAADALKDTDEKAPARPAAAAADTTPPAPPSPGVPPVRP